MWKTTLIFLSAVLLTTLLALSLTACASPSPCHPTIRLSTISAMNERADRAGMVDSVGLTCLWSY